MKKEILKYFDASAGTLTIKEIVMGFIVAIIIAMIIYASYRFSHSGAVYSRKFNVSLVMITLITTLIMTVIGGSGLIGCIAWLLFLPYDEFVVFVMSVVFVALLAVGIGFFVNYKVGKKMLEKEMQAELDNMSVASKSGEQSQTPVCKQTDISDSAEAREDTDRVEADE